MLDRYNAGRQQCATVGAQVQAAHDRRQEAEGALRTFMRTQGTENQAAARELRETLERRKAECETEVDLLSKQLSVPFFDECMNSEYNAAMRAGAAAMDTDSE